MMNIKEVTTGISKTKIKYWGRHFLAIGYERWSTGSITDKMVNDYLEHHRKSDDSESSNFILNDKRLLVVKKPMDL